MVVEHMFDCAHKGCKAHAHVKIYCHDEQKYNPDLIGNALGFKKQTIHQGAFTFGSQWYCEDHAHE